MNEYLLYSSIITGCILLLIIYNNYTPKYNILYLFIFLGIITSILNHGFYSITYKYIDRFIMIVNVVLFIYFIMQLSTHKKLYKIVILILACITYLLSKIQKNMIVRDTLHSFSHFLSVLLLYLLHK